MKKFNVNQLKYFAAFFMFLDSMYYAIPGSLPSWVHLITRFVAPLFAFFTVEGFFHTRDRLKYLQRLWIAAALMQAGNYVSYLIMGARYQIPDNIFLTLALGVSIMFAAEKAKSSDGWKKAAFYALSACIFLAGCAFSVIPITLGGYVFGLEAGIQILTVIVTFYAFYGNRKRQVIAFLICNALFLPMFGVTLPSQYENLGVWFDMFCHNSDGLTFLFLPFLLLYNGEKGKKSAFNRYFFYVFYPAHIWILRVIGFLIQQK